MLEISSKIKTILEAAEMWPYSRMLRISWTENANNDEVLEKIESNRKLILNIWKTRVYDEERGLGKLYTHMTD